MGLNETASWYLHSVVAPAEDEERAYRAAAGKMVWDKKVPSLGPAFVERKLGAIALLDKRVATTLDGVHRTMETIW